MSGLAKRKPTLHLTQCIFLVASWHHNAQHPESPPEGLGAPNPPPRPLQPWCHRHCHRVLVAPLSCPLCSCETAHLAS